MYSSPIEGILISYRYLGGLFYEIDKPCKIHLPPPTKKKEKKQRLFPKSRLELIVRRLFVSRNHFSKCAPR